MEDAGAGGKRHRDVDPAHADARGLPCPGRSVRAWRSGPVELMDDEVMLDFLARQGAQASYVTSVCTGSLLLAAAGLLKGYRAPATGWLATTWRCWAPSIAERVVLDETESPERESPRHRLRAHSSRPPARRNASQSDSARAGIRSRPSFRDRISRTAGPGLVAALAEAPRASLGGRRAATLRAQARLESRG